MNLDAVEEVVDHVLQRWPDERSCLQLEIESAHRRISGASREGPRHFEIVHRA